MKQHIRRTYTFTPLELKEAIWDYLKKIDRPYPEKAQELDVTKMNDNVVIWSEDLIFEDKK